MTKGYRIIGALALGLLLTTTTARAGVCEEWNALYNKIRDFQIVPAQAQAEFGVLHQQLQATYGSAGVGGTERYYPVVGYDSRWGEQGSGYRPKGYKFFTGNPQGIHPSLDLFVLDKNQDALDDATGAPFTIIANSGGVVVGMNTVWNYPDARRGGKYLWIYDPLTEHYNYYAHLNRIDVQLGQIVRAGEPLGILGRTGKNAYMQRSPTHLHLMVLAYRNGEMVPYTPWTELLVARPGRSENGEAARIGEKNGEVGR